jgi:hypothetical protein
LGLEIKRVAFNEIPAEIQELAKKEFREEAEVLGVTEYNYSNGIKEYTICAVDDLAVLEFDIHSKRGITRFNRVSFSAILLAMEKVQRKFSS